MQAAVFLALFLLAASTVADVSRSVCFDLPFITRDVCISTLLQSCGASATVNATFGPDTVVPTTQFNSSQFRECFDVPYGVIPGSCEVCLSFSSADFTPTSARLCPVMDVCTGTRLSGSCFTLGNDCSASSCGSCLGSSSCGWCHSQQRCIASLDSTPYCSSCNASWITDATSCPAPAPTQPSSEGLGQSAKIAIGVIVPIGVISAVLVVCFLVRKRKTAQAPATTSSSFSGGVVPVASGEPDRDISVHSDRSISLTRPITGGLGPSDAHDPDVDAHSTPLTAHVASDSLDPRYEPPTAV